MPCRIPAPTIYAPATQPAGPELKPDSDLTVDPRFVDTARDDFRLRADTSLLRIGDFPYLGALPPLTESPLNLDQRGINSAVGRPPSGGQPVCYASR